MLDSQVDIASNFSHHYPYRFLFTKKKDINVILEQRQDRYYTKANEYFNSGDNSRSS